MDNIKLYEEFDYQKEIILVMMNDQPLGLVEGDLDPTQLRKRSRSSIDPFEYAIKEVIINEGGYDEVELHEFSVSDQMGDHPNLCIVDGSKVNIHLIRLSLYG